MATLSVSDIRRRIADDLIANGWKASRTHGASYPGQETAKMAAKSFAIYCPSTTLDSPLESRRGALGGRCTSEVRVRWLWSLKAAVQVEDGDAALDAENELIHTLLAVSQIDCHISVSSCSRSIVGDGTYLLGEISLEVIHRISTQAI